MSSQFIALPVGKGDSFYLKRTEGSVLFDGGQAQSLPDLIKFHINSNKIDILICSHNDADHAKGLISLLNDSDISISQVWLPGRWAEIIHRIYTNNLSFIFDVDNNLNLATDACSLEEFSEHIRCCPPENRENIRSNKPSEINFNLDQIITSSLPSIFDLLDCARHTSNFRRRRTARKLAKEAILAAHRIIVIATLAKNKNCTLRWFDFEKFEKSKQPSGGESWLHPLNSVEVTTHTSTDYSNLDLLALSVANKESLAFYSNVNGEPSVVFTADTALANVSIPNLSNPLVTAPHHGSSANRGVYKMPSFASATWVRSDMRAPKRPCHEFIAQQNKYCTRCRNKSSFEQSLVFHSHNGTWISQSANCCCI